MSEQKTVEFEDMTFTHHVTLRGLSKGWYHEESGEWVNAVEKMYLNEIFKRGSQLTTLREENKNLEQTAQLLCDFINEQGLDAAALSDEGEKT